MAEKNDFKKKIPVAVLGATGLVGQRICQLLDSHPWFELSCLSASDRSVGMRFGDVIDSQNRSLFSNRLQNMFLEDIAQVKSCPIVFSALDASCAEKIESDLAKRGLYVFSNAGCHRFNEKFPLIVPEVNPDHLNLLKDSFRISNNISGEGENSFPGFIVTNPNCVVAGISVAIKPLFDAFGIKSLSIVTMQAISGAGRQAPEVNRNIIPYIDGEEEKIEKEPLKIFGKLVGTSIIFRDMLISAQCSRVDVVDGHLASISVTFEKKPELIEVVSAFQDFTPDRSVTELPTAVANPIHVFEENCCPQPKLHCMAGQGMQVSVGRIRPCPVHDYKFIVLSHNLYRGAAGAALLNAELALRRNIMNLNL